VKNPDGCSTCWTIWEDAAHSPGRVLPTVVIELGIEEARVVALALNAMLHRASGGDVANAEVLRPFCNQLLRQVRDAGA
jgi:hypothetical protein